MRIGFDVSQTGQDKSGCGYFADSLIQALAARDDANHYILYPYFGNCFWDPDGAKTTRNLPDRPNVSRILTGRTFRQSLGFWEQLPANGEAMIGRPDLVHANNFSCPRNLSRARLVYTLYDLSFLIYPEFTFEQTRWNCFRGVFDASCHADFIVAISDYSRNSFLEVFPHYPADRIRVVPLGSRFSSRTGQNPGWVVADLERDRFWLTVGTLEPRKNLRRLLRAYGALARQHQGMLPLVLAGGKGWLEDDLEAFIDALGLREHVRIPGYVSDEQLIWLYRNCFAFLYPSHFEGFGLPVLEALSLGAAVMTSKTTSLPEVAGDAACYVDPSKEEEMIVAMSRLMSDEAYRRERKRLSASQAAKFSWNRCASEVIDIYEEVAKRPKLDLMASLHRR